MITINIKRNEKNEIIKFSLDGHAGYAESGSDIVCAAVSAITNMIIIGFEKLNIIPSYEKDDEGYLSFELPEDLSEEQNEKIQYLLNCMVEEFMDIQKNYVKYVKVNEI
jgi:uncharacterized protein YsxB (DUF464 family)